MLPADTVVPLIVPAELVGTPVEAMVLRNVQDVYNTIMEQAEAAFIDYVRHQSEQLAMMVEDTGVRH